MQISNWTLLRNYLLTEHENRLWLQLNSLFSCTSLDAWMITSTAARIELLVCKANARSFICAHCVQSADLQVCCPTSFTSLPNDLSPEGPAAVGVAHRIRRAVKVSQLLGVSGGCACKASLLHIHCTTSCTLPVKLWLKPHLKRQLTSVSWPFAGVTGVWKRRMCQNPHGSTAQRCKMQYTLAPRGAAP